MTTQAALDKAPVGILGATIITSSGTYFDYLSPETSELTIVDIAAGLSRCCRFTGQLLQHIPHYSVAQHSVLVSEIVPPEHAMAGLLHDAAEAFMGDMNSPLKRLCPEYKAIERRVEEAVLARFGVPMPLSPEVKRADYIALFTEKRDLTAGASHGWPGSEDYPPLPQTIQAWDQQRAFVAFLNRFSELGGPR